MNLLVNGSQLSAIELSDLERAVVISLFTWRRADDTDDYDDVSLYGWWGDIYPTVANDRIGSKLYQLIRKKITDELLLEAQEMCEQALAWLIDDGYVDDITASCERSDTNSITVAITLTIGNNSTLIEFSEIK